MTTDLSKKSVKQLRRMSPGHDDLLHDCVIGEAFDELATRLKSAQEQIVAQTAPPVGWVRIVEGHSGPVAAGVEWQPEKPDRPGLWRALYMSDHSNALKAEVAAKALNDFLDLYKLRDKVDIWPISIAREVAAEMIAEYRAKAGRKE